MQKSFALSCAIVASLSILAEDKAMVRAEIPGGSLADCQRVAAMFDNTCEGNSPDNGKTMTCTGRMECPGISGLKDYTQRSPCTFTRKLCVQCF